MLLNRSFEEAGRGIVRIDDIDPDTIGTMLKYLYAEPLDKEDYTDPRLYYAADKYDLVGLRTQCKISIAAGMSKENAAEILLLGVRWVKIIDVDDIALQVLFVQGNRIVRTMASFNFPKYCFDVQVISVFSGTILRISSLWPPTSSPQISSTVLRLGSESARRIGT